MTKLIDKVKHGDEEAARILDEYKQRLDRVIGEEREKIKKGAEEMEQVLREARREAEQGAEQFISLIRES